MFQNTFVMQQEKTRASCLMNSVPVSYKLYHAKPETQYVFILDAVKAYLKVIQVIFLSKHDSKQL